jgi:DNA-binding response OmpR family regulator
MLSSGVDVLVLRPYSVRVIIAQVKAMLRRGGSPLLSQSAYVLGSVRLDPSNRTVQVAGAQPVRLTQLEYRLLYTLMLHAGQILSLDSLLTHVWGYNSEGDRDLVRGLVKRLRSKVEPDPQSPTFIRNEPGLGYVFLVDNPESFDIST